MSYVASNPISVRLDDDIRDTLERDAAQRGVGLATYLRDLATERARTIRKADIRAESRRVGKLVKENQDARDFYEAWGTPSSER